MRSLVESVIKFNGRVMYGCDRGRSLHDQKWIVYFKGGYAQVGQVAVIFDESGKIVDRQVFSNKDKAYRYLLANVPSEGIMA